MRKILVSICCMLVAAAACAQGSAFEQTLELGSDRIAYLKDERWGLADTQGRILTPPLWVYIEGQYSDRPIESPVVVTALVQGEERQGLIDTQGNEILSAQWGRLERLDSGVCIAWKDGLFRGSCCTLSAQGEPIQTLPESAWTQAMYLDAAYNVLFGTLPDGRFGWFALGQDGRIALMCAEEDWKAEAQGIVYEDGYVYVRRENQVGFMALDGSVLTDESWKAFELYNSDYGIVKTEDALVCVGLRGQKTLSFPAEYGAGKPVFDDGRWYIPLAVYDQASQRLLCGWADEDGLLVQDFE